MSDQQATLLAALTTKPGRTGKALTNPLKKLLKTYETHAEEGRTNKIDLFGFTQAEFDEELETLVEHAEHKAKQLAKIDTAKIIPSMELAKTYLELMANETDRLAFLDRARERAKKYSATDSEEDEEDNEEQTEMEQDSDSLSDSDEP